jgi:DNA polymerase (family 10)
VVRGPRGNYRADLFLATRAERPYALFHYTGPASYNVRVRAHAKRLGFRLNQYGLFERATGRRAPAVRSEAGLARRLGLAARPPGARR